MNPLVSVVMATYRGDRLEFLQLAVQSILDQTYPNIEFLIALDGPVNPDTQDYLDRIAADHDTIRILPLPENQGAAHARNAAFREARGDYIAIMDADDTCAPNRIERQLAHIQETGADVVSTFMNYIDDTGALIGKKDMFISNEDLRRTALFLNPINNATVLARAEIFRDYPYDETFRRGHDYHLWARLIVAGRTLVNLPEHLYNCRTGIDFLARRSSLQYFIIELRVKLLLLKIYPWYKKPYATAIALTLPLLRLLPPSALRLVYRLRNAVRTPK